MKMQFIHNIFEKNICILTRPVQIFTTFECKDAFQDQKMKMQ